MFCEIYVSKEFHFEKNMHLQQVGSHSAEQEAHETKWSEKAHLLRFQIMRLSYFKKKKTVVF